MKEEPPQHAHNKVTYVVPTCKNDRTQNVKINSEMSCIPFSNSQFIVGTYLFKFIQLALRGC